MYNSLQFDWIGLHLVKLLNPNQSNWRPAVQLCETMLVYQIIIPTTNQLKVVSCTLKARFKVL